MVKQTPEGNLWKIWTHDGKGNMLDCVGHVIVYVDDVLVAACEDVRKGFFGETPGRVGNFVSRRYDM